MSEQITIVGNAGTEPVVDKGEDGRTFTRFRVGCARRFRDPQSGEWRDTESSWYDVHANGMLADNIIKSVSKGTRVVVTGVLSVRKWTRNERSGINVTIRAESVGIDLQWAKVPQIIKTSTTHRAENDRDTAPQVDEVWMAAVEGETPPEHSESGDAVDADPETGEVYEKELEPTPF